MGRRKPKRRHRVVVRPAPAVAQPVRPEVELIPTPDGLTCRALNPVLDEHVFRSAWEFWADYPPWFQEMEPRKDIDAYLAEVRDPRRISFGVFKGVEVVALIRFYEIVPGHTEISTEARRHGVEWSQLADLCYKCGFILFEYMPYQEEFAWIPAMHHANLRMAEKAGLEWDGVRLVRATAHGKPVVWKRMRIHRHTYEDYHRHRYMKEVPDGR